MSLRDNGAISMPHLTNGESMNELQEERRLQQQEERAEAIEQMAKDIFAEMGGDIEDCIELAQEQFK
jgi:hypothetical protein